MRTKPFKSILTSVIIITLLLPFFSTLLAQEEAPPTLFFEFGYMQSKNDDYVAMERELWKGIHQHRVDNGNLVWWGLFAVVYPGGTHRNYNYVTLNVYDDISLIEEGYTDYEAWVKAAHPNLEMEKLEKRTGDSRDIVWNEVFQHINTAIPPGGNPPKYVVANRMKVKPGGGSAYVAMEQEVFMPVHKLAAEKGFRNNWALLGRAMPYGTEFDYNFMTLDAYDNMKQMTTGTPQEVWNEAHKGMNTDILFDNIDMNEIRQLTRGEVWQLLEHTTSPD